jgi:cytochrome oxidase assembly protein ShyY1
MKYKAPAKLPRMAPNPNPISIFMKRSMARTPDSVWRWRDGVWVGLWLALIALLLGLGVWQWRRAEAKAALQAHYDQARARAPRMLDASAQAVVHADGQRVRVQGYWVPERTVFLDNRTYRGVAGFYVLTPVRWTVATPDGGRAERSLLILRGWVPRASAQRTQLPAVPTPPDRVTIEGWAMAEWPQPRLLNRAGLVAEADGRLLQHLDWAAYRVWSGLPVLDGLIRQTGPQVDTLVRDWPEPGPHADRHRAYAAQWFAMAAALSVLGLVAARRRQDRAG